ncbi:Hpt domain-containing protein [Actinoplanes sp. OR16]|uniref:Hpt domain-containing protein n=1 Tax=Actinoplanes sp. OR16 TaxID=946334 RepID=UPI001E3BEA8C|nr:Hpt domain-containing protein [Actinoplanes sp. OR16]
MGIVAPPSHDERVTAVRARLNDITDGDPGPGERALLARLLRSFAAKAPAAADELIDVLDGDTGVLRERAHALKGSSANIGATALAAICAAVETDARAGNRPDPATAAHLRDEIAGMVRAVTEVADAYER